MDLIALILAGATVQRGEVRRPIGNGYGPGSGPGSGDGYGHGYYGVGHGWADGNGYGPGSGNGCGDGYGQGNGWSLDYGLVTFQTGTLEVIRWT